MTQYSNLLLIEGRKNGPDFIAKIPTEYDCWREVGVAFYNPKTQSITLYLDALPVKGKLVFSNPTKRILRVVKLVHEFKELLRISDA